MPKKPRKRDAPKLHDQLRHALGHKVEDNPKAYTRKLKNPEEDNLEFISLEPPDT